MCSSAAHSLQHTGLWKNRYMSPHPPSRLASSAAAASSAWCRWPERRDRETVNCWACYPLATEILPRSQSSDWWLGAPRASETLLADLLSHMLASHTRTRLQRTHTHKTLIHVSRRPYCSCDPLWLSSGSGRENKAPLSITKLNRIGTAGRRELCKEEKMMLLPAECNISWQ